MSEALDANYEQAGYHFKQNLGLKPALLLVDFAKAYFKKDSPLFGGPLCETAREAAVELTNSARKNNVPVIFTEVLYRPGGLDGGAFYSKVPALSCFDQGRETQELCDGFDKRDTELMVTKQYPSAFFGTSLSASLAFLKVDTLVIAGLTTSGCVRATCIDSISSGFITVIAEDACGDRAMEPHQANLFDMSAKYADLMKNHEVLDYFKSSKVT